MYAKTTEYQLNNNDSIFSILLFKQYSNIANRFSILA